MHQVNYIYIYVIKWTDIGEKVLKVRLKMHENPRLQLKIRKQSSSVEINMSCFSTRMMMMKMMKMIPNTAKQTLDWFQRKRISPDSNPIENKS